MINKYLEYKDEKSHKFLQIEVKDNEFTVVFGKIGTKGQTRGLSFDDNERALKNAKKIIKQKLKKGCKEVEKTTEKEEAKKSKLENFKQKFASHKLPKTLIELIKFDDLSEKRLL